MAPPTHQRWNLREGGRVSKFRKAPSPRRAAVAGTPSAQWSCGRRWPALAPGQSYVRIAPQRQPHGLAAALGAVGEGERPGPVRRDPDAEAGAGLVAERVWLGARPVGAVSISLTFMVSSLSLCVSGANKLAIQYQTVRDGTSMARHASKPLKPGVSLLHTAASRRTAYHKNI
jgi:hypothetical protein